jgi:hypothetical protein
MTSRSLLLLIGLTSAWLLCPDALTFAQIDPNHIRSGMVSQIGDVELSFFTVPAGLTFVLTDIFWSTNVPVDTQMQEALQIRANTTLRFETRGKIQHMSSSTFQFEPLQSHFTTGLVFTPGTQLTVRPLSQPAGVAWIFVWSGYVASSTTAVGEATAPAKEARLGQNTPNPFNPTTEIRYSLESPGEVNLRIYDSNGRLMRTLVEARAEAGENVVVWDGRDDAGRSLASGVYHYELSTERGRETRKAVLLR